MSSLDRTKTTAVLKSAGEVQLKFISVADIQEFHKIIENKNLTNKEKVKNILFHQLRFPQLRKEEFLSLPDDEVQSLAKAFIKAEDYSFKNYKDTEHFYEDFVTALKKSYEEEVERAEKMMAPFIEAAQKSVTQFAEQITEINKSYYFPEALKQANLALVKFQTIDVSRLAVLTEESSKLWKNYFSLTDSINTNALSLLSKQYISPKKELIPELNDVFTVVRKNEEIFAGNIKTLPEAEKLQIIITNDFIENMLSKVKTIIENDSFFMFWKARAKEDLYPNPERIAQGHIMGLLTMGLSKKLFFVDQQTRAGAGFIDISITFYNGQSLERVLLELKVFEKGHNLNDGIEQLFKYMKTKDTLLGYRVILNATGNDLTTVIQKRGNFTLKDVVIDINPIQPSSLD